MKRFADLRVTIATALLERLERPYPLQCRALRAMSGRRPPGWEQLTAEFSALAERLHESRRAERLAAGFSDSTVVR